MKQKNHILMT